MDVREGGFELRVENGRTRFGLKVHHASEDAARSAIEERYIPELEFVVGLERGPNMFRLRFDRTEIVDWDPTPGLCALSVRLGLGSSSISAALAPPVPYAFPKPPDIGIR